jgi:CheY-like chemotaxis protein
MPEMDGFAVAKQIRDKPELSSTTLMMLTSAAAPLETGHAVAN